MANETTKPNEKDTSLQATVEATNAICKVLVPFTPDQRSTIMRAVAALLGVKSGGPGAGTPRQSPPAQQGNRR